MSNDISQSIPNCIHTTISHAGFVNLDPSFADHFNSELSFHYTSHSVNDHLHVRVLPRIHGVPVFNADRVFSIHRRSGELDNFEMGATLTVRETWDNRTSAISELQAVNIVRGNAGHITSKVLKLSVSEPSFPDEKDEVEYNKFMADQVYFAEHTLLNEIRPAWRIMDYNQPLLSRHLWYIDASTGKILQSQPTVLFGHGRGYKFDVKKPKPPKTSMVDINITNILAKSPYNDGKGVYGRDFRSMNTCFAYVCSNSSSYGKEKASEGTCNENESICVDITPGMKEGKDYFTASYDFVVNGRYIDLDRDWDAEGYVDGRIYLSWDRAAIMAPRLGVSPGGGYNMELDEKNYFGTEYNDGFNEFQAVYYADLQVQYFRELVGDNDFCLIGRGSNCKAKDSLQNRAGTPLDSPLKIITNLQTVKAHPSPNSPYPDLFTQLSKGLGKNASHPILFRESEPYGDAFYSNSNRQVPGLYIVTNSTKPDEVVYGFNDTRDCTKGKCLSTFSTMYDIIGMGQNDNYDWSLNDCIVMHEVTHALIGKLIPDLPSYVWTKDGMSSDPGAMNEAWADYFGAAKCGIANFKETYNGRPLRTLVNTFTCRNSVGEMHTDGQIFGGALWAVRLQIPSTTNLNSTHQIEFDKVVLRAIAQGQPTDLFDTQLNRVLSILSEHKVFSKTGILQFAKEEFERRVLKCEREMNYDGTMDTTFILPTSALTPANISTMPVQLLIKPRKSDWGFKIEWKQYYQSPVLGQVDFGYARTKLSMYMSINCPIRFVSSANSITAQANCPSGATEIPVTYATHDAKTSTGYVEMNFSPGDHEKVYLWFAHHVPAYIVMYSTTLIWYGWNRVWIIFQIALGGFGVLVGLTWCAWRIWGCLRRRRLEKAAKTELDTSKSLPMMIKREDSDTYLNSLADRQQTTPSPKFKELFLQPSVEHIRSESRASKLSEKDHVSSYATVEDVLREEEDRRWSFLNAASHAARLTIVKVPSHASLVSQISSSIPPTPLPAKLETTIPPVAKESIQKRNRCCCSCSKPSQFTIQMVVFVIISAAISAVGTVGLLVPRFLNLCLLITFFCAIGIWMSDLSVWIWYQVEMRSKSISMPPANYDSNDDALPNNTSITVNITVPTAERTTAEANLKAARSSFVARYKHQIFLVISILFLISNVCGILVTNTHSILVGKNKLDIDPSTPVHVVFFTLYMFVMSARMYFVYRWWRVLKDSM
ncbi:hypothetical protein HK098_001748 [Nowakowskiella sp. JEL0407]|nr:hypothetical protein HK098_001748 [Nowakowskiella sp. JEL0407]